MDWGELASLVKDEKKKNPHSVANLIHRLVLDKNTVILLLSDPQEDFDDILATLTHPLYLSRSINTSLNDRRYGIRRRELRWGGRGRGWRQRKEGRKESTQHHPRTRASGRRYWHLCICQRQAVSFSFEVVTMVEERRHVNWLV